MKFCPKCGQQVPERGRFCRGCGAPLSQRKTKPAAVETTASGSSTAATASPPPLAARTPIEDEPEIPPPPPAKGVALTWHRAANGAIRRADEATAGRAVVTVGGDGSGSASAIIPASVRPLPPLPAQWPLRTQTSAWADAAAASLAGGKATPGGASLPGVVARLIRGALMQRDIYRDVAQRTDVETEAYGLAGAIILAGYVGAAFFSFAGLFGGFSLKVLLYVAVVQAVAWAAAVIAIQVAAKSLHQLELSPLVLFRALIYAQAGTLLSFLPVIGGLTGLWGGVCTAAALHDLTGKRTIDAVVLTLIGGLAAAVAAYIARMFVS